MLNKFIGESAFKLAGWQYHVEPDVLEDKQVIVGFEHTSMMDAVLSLALFKMYDIKIHTLIKKELFKGPMKPILEAMGGIAVDRKANKDIVSVMVEHFQNNEKFNLVIAPEATRAKMVKRVNRSVPVSGILPKLPMCQLCLCTPIPRPSKAGFWQNLPD